MDDVANNSAMRHAKSLRMRSLVLPREHGAWGMLLIPLLSGAAVGLSQTPRSGPVLLLAVAAVALFWLRTPVESLIGSSPMRARTQEEHRLVVVCAALIAALAALLLALLLWQGRNPLLLLLGAVAGMSFLAQALVRRGGRHGRMTGQFIGAFGLTSTAAAAFYVVTGQVDRHALALWLANWIFAAFQIQFVQLRIHAVKLKLPLERMNAGRAFFVGELLLALLLLYAWLSGVMPALVLVAFLPLIVRGIAWFFLSPQPLRLHRLGFVELAHAVVFGTLLSAAFIL
jgi:hypothetical protein